MEWLLFYFLGLELDFKPPPDDTLAPHEINRIKQLEFEEGGVPSTKENSSSSSNFTGCGPSAAPGSTVPVLSFGLDLKYWGDKEVVPAEVPRNNSDCHRFWRPSDERFAFMSFSFSDSF